jgi:hypothetical protein
MSCESALRNSCVTSSKTQRITICRTPGARSARRPNRRARGVREGRALAGHQVVAADAWRRVVLLHRGVLGAELLDRLDMRAGFDAR